MPWNALRRTAPTAALVVLLSACGGGGGSGGSPSPEVSGPCKQVVADGQQATADAVQAVDAFQNLAINLGPGVVTDDLKAKGARARATMLVWLHLIKKNPDCFAPALVAQAEKTLPRWEPAGATPRPDTQVPQ